MLAWPIVNWCIMNDELMQGTKPRWIIDASIVYHTLIVNLAYYCKHLMSSWVFALSDYLPVRTAVSQLRRKTNCLYQQFRHTRSKLGVVVPATVDLDIPLHWVACIPSSLWCQYLDNSMRLQFFPPKQRLKARSAWQQRSCKRRRPRVRFSFLERWAMCLSTKRRKIFPKSGEN